MLPTTEAVTKKSRKDWQLIQQNHADEEHLGRSRHLCTKLKILKACIYSSATYSCETWTLNGPILKSIIAFEIKCLGRISRPSWTERGTNQLIREELTKCRRELAQNIGKKTKAEIFFTMQRDTKIWVRLLWRTLSRGKKEEDDQSDSGKET